MKHLVIIFFHLLGHSFYFIEWVDYMETKCHELIEINHMRSISFRLQFDDDVIYQSHRHSNTDSQKQTFIDMR